MLAGPGGRGARRGRVRTDRHHHRALAFEGRGTSERLGRPQASSAAQALPRRPSRPGCRAAAPGGRFFDQVAGESEAGLMRLSSPFSCRHSPGPTLLQPAGSAGAVVRRLMFPQFRCPGRLRAIVARAQGGSCPTKRGARRARRGKRRYSAVE